MIRKMRMQFIGAAALAVAVVLVLIMGTINIVNYRNVLVNADQVLEMLAENDGEFPNPLRKGDGAFEGKKESAEEEPAPPKDMPDNLTEQSDSDDHIFDGRAFTEETPYETRYFSVELNAEGSVTAVNTSFIAAVDEETAEQYAESIWESGKLKGFQSYYRYIVCEDGDVTRIIFVDCQRILSNFFYFLFVSVLISVFGFLAVFVLIVLASKRIIQPVAESYQKQRQFITDAGHELKTPLTIIDADVSVAEMDFGENEWLDDVKVQTKRLAQLTNDLIYLSKMDESENREQMIEFPLSEVVQETAQSFRARAQVEEKEYDVQIAPMIGYLGNEAAIEKLITILLDNAFKYSDDNGKISLSLKQKSKGIEIVVYNTAEKIDEQMTAHMFDRFYRADKSRNSGTGGYGLGLSIAAAIVAAHKGRITAKTEDEKSLRITVLLP